MTGRTIFRVTAYAWLAAAVVGVWLALSRTAPDIEWAERNSAVVAQAARAQRLRADSASKATARVVTRVVEREARVDTSLAVVQSDAEEARKLLADSTATLAKVRASYCLTLERLDVLVADVSAYKREVVALRDTLTIERAEVQAALQMWADSVPKANQAVLNAYRAELRNQRLKLAAWVGGTGLILWVAAK